MAKHTPGPWAMVDDIDENGVIEAHDGGLPICVCVVGNPESPVDEVDTANGRLIAAAPDLLEALEGVLGMAENFLELHLMQNARKDPDISRARAAIAKARGE